MLLVAILSMAAWWLWNDAPPVADTTTDPAIPGVASKAPVATSASGDEEFVVRDSHDIEKGPDIASHRYVITGLTSPQEIIDLVGVAGNYDRWMKERGYVFEAALMESYFTFSEEELRQLHEQGDALASALLANKLINQGSPEALNISRQLVADGSIFNMSALSIQYLRLSGAIYQEDRQRPEEQAPYLADPESMLIEAMAWSLLSETYEGKPRGSLVDTWDEILTRGDSDPVNIAAACQRAAELQSDLAYEWDSAGFVTPDIKPAPFHYGNAHHSGWVTEACPNSVLTMPDLARCIRVELVDEFGDSEEAMVCPTD